MSTTVTPLRRDPRLGWKPELPDARDRQFNLKRAMRKLRNRLPSHIDHRDFIHAKMGALPEQGNLGACVPHGVTFAYRRQQLVQTLDDYNPSRLFVYYNGRVLENTITLDDGLFIRDGLKSIGKFGAPHEDLCPYNIGEFAEIPSTQAYVDGLEHQAIAYESVPVKTTEVKAATAAGHFVIIGFTVYTSFFYTGADGFVREPDVAKEHVEGGHCMDVVGYARMRAPWETSHYDYAIMANWWDPTFGDNGYCYMKMRWLCNQQNADDFWIITQAEA